MTYDDVYYCELADHVWWDEDEAESTYQIPPFPPDGAMLYILREDIAMLVSGCGTMSVLCSDLDLHDREWRP